MKQHDLIESALVLHLAGKYIEAEFAYRRILATDPQHVAAKHYLGMLLHQTGNTSQALELIRSAIAADARSPGRYNDLGNILTEINELNQAAAAFRCALALNAQDANVWNNLGSVLHHLHDLSGAEAAYLSALRLDVNFVPALSNLAVLLAETGREPESALFSSQAYIQPPLEGKSAKILAYAYYQLERLTDAAECYRAWLSSEPDNAFAKHHLAACTAENVPIKATGEYLQALFNDMSEHFDQKLIGKLGYRGPEIIAGLLKAHLAANSGLHVLDGGCGTGLCGAVLKPYARYLTGVDISPGMLSKAAEKLYYDQLVEMELSTYLWANPHSWDLIVMADTLIYFGELAGLFTAVRQALRPGGRFAFTIEAVFEKSVSYQLTPSGRYCHQHEYIQQLLEALGFKLLQTDEATLRKELGKPANGYGILAQLI